MESVDPEPAKFSKKALFVKKESLQTGLAGLLAACLLLIFAYQFPQSIERLNNAAIDWQISFLPAHKISDLPVLVEVDEQSLASYGQWPWPRYRIARLMEAIQKAGARSVAIDALFVETDRTSPLEIQRHLAQDFNQDFSLTAIDQAYWNYDEILGQAVHTGPFVLSYYFSYDGLNTNSCQPKSASAALLSNELNEHVWQNLHSANGIVCNISALQEHANQAGFINAAADPDGLYRKAQLVIPYHNRVYPSLALQAYLTSEQIEHFIFSPKPLGFTLQAGKHEVPLDSQGRLWLNFPKKNQKFTKFSAQQILKDQIKGDELRGKLVLVGFSAAGLHEIRPTPNNSDFLGVEFHATVLDNLIRNDFFYRPEQLPFIEVMLAALIGVGLMIGLAKAGPIASVVAPSALLLLMVVGSYLIIANTGILVSPFFPILLIVISLLLLLLIKYIREYFHAKTMALLVAKTQEGIIESFCSMSEYRDPETGAHIKRTQNYIKALAIQLQHHPKFANVLTDDNIDFLYKTAPLHDIGKIGIRDNILLKDDRLADDEFQTMKMHPEIGAEIIRSVAMRVGWNEFMTMAFQICLYHQEKWDGSGYPKGLSGDLIPYPARFMAIADVYDALISKRVYKPAFSHETAVSLIVAGKNKHFDPVMVEAFQSIHLQFRDIALEFLDSEEQRQTLLARTD